MYNYPADRPQTLPTRAALVLLAVLPLAAQIKPPNLAGVWTGIGLGKTAAGHQNTPLPDASALTAAGLEQMKANPKAADPTVKRCWPPGPVRLMSADREWPLEIVETRDGLAIINHVHYMARRIYTDGRSHPNGWDPPPYNGHATGKWEGSTLVAETVLLNDKVWLSPAGLPQSDEMKMVERLSTLENGKVLEDQMTLTDSKFYRAPVAVSRYWLSTPKVELPPISFACQEKLKVVVSK